MLIHLIAMAPGLLLALIIASGLLFAAGRRRAHGSAARVRTTLREQTRRTAFLPQRDPAAAGRPRPRAPSQV